MPAGPTDYRRSEEMWKIGLSWAKENLGGIYRHNS